MNGPEFFERVAELERARETFAIATVVARQAPVSSHVGDRAIVLDDGRMQGFVGGSCSRDIVRRQAVSAMRTGDPRLVQIRPGAPPDADEDSERGTVVVPMSCASEGAVDVFVEPHLPARTLLIAGFTPVADALAGLGALLDGYRVIRVVADKEPVENAVALEALPEFIAGLDAVERSALVAVVASQGHYDEAALEALLAGELPAYVGLLASRRRAAGVLDVLAQQGLSLERLAIVRNPAGLDIGARRPGDVAVSILAEIVATVAASETRPVKAGELAELALDPVCGMDVDPRGASHFLASDGSTTYFCSAHCRAAFSADPQRFAQPVHA
jgi:xanthine dehydrogenase accessory factor